MPNAAQIKKAQELREAKANAKAANAEAAAAELLATSKKSEAQAVERGNSDPLAAERALEEAKRKPRPVVNSKDRKKAEKEAARAAAQKQADEDVRVVAQPDEKPLSYYRENGIEPPLHVLNRQAQEADVALRDDARELARAVGQMAYQQALAPRGRHSRERKINKFLDEAAAAQRTAEQAAQTQE